MLNRIWVLGAADPEMAAIEQLLRDAGETVVYAVAPDGKRVHPGNATRAIGWHHEDRFYDAASNHHLFMVECDIPGLNTDTDVSYIDHHRAGDPGYGQEPEAFMVASSIGQVISYMARMSPYNAVFGGWTSIHTFGPKKAGEVVTSKGQWIVGRGCASSLLIPTDIMLAAAADHCLAAAYRGECPGVDPDALMAWRVSSRAAFQRRSTEEILADVELAREALRSAPQMVLRSRSGHCGGSSCGCGEGSYGSGDPGATTRNGTGDCYCECDGCASSDGPVYARDMRGMHVPELPEASAREGVCFVADGLPGPDGRVKTVCQSGSPEQIRAFMGTFAPAHGITDIYGDPARGFAGGYYVL